MKCVKLNQLCEINIGKTPSRSNSKYWGKGHKWLSIADMKSKYISETKEEITDLAVSEANMKIVPKNTVLMSFKLSIGKIGITTEEMYTNEAIASFPIIEKEKIIPEYLYYVLKTLRYDNLSDRAVMGATLNKKKLNQIVIPLPSIIVQKKIVNLLNKAEELIDKRKAQIEALDQLTQSVFLEMFGDPLRNNKNLPVVPLSNLAEIIMGQSPKGDSYNTKGDGTPLLNGPTEFGNTYPKEKQWTTNPKKICFKDDILFCVRGATAGRMNFADKEYCIGRGLAAIRCNNKNDIPFIYQTLKFLYKYFQSTSNGSTFINIDKKTLQNVPVLQVDNVQLEKYFTTIKKIEEQKKVLSESVLLLEENYNSIMQRAFKGELFTEEKVSNL